MTITYTVIAVSGASNCGTRVAGRSRRANLDNVSEKQTFRDFVGLTRRNSRQGRIYKGTDASIATYPFMAAITKDGVFVCNGAVIKSNFILTHSKCYDGPISAPS